MMKNLWLSLFCLGMLGIAPVLAQDVPVEGAAGSEGIAAVEEPVVAEAPAAAEDSATNGSAASETPASAEDAAAKTSALDEEKELKKQADAVLVGLEIQKVFKKRLPNYFRDVDLMKKQISAIYSIQREYFDVLAPLEARVERLKAERDEAVLNVLTEEQKTLYQEKVDSAQKERNEKKSKKEAESESQDAENE